MTHIFAAIIRTFAAALDALDHVCRSEAEQIRKGGHR